MAALTATDWTVSIERQQIEGKTKRVRARLTLATLGEYTSNGIPLPPAGKFGFKQTLAHVILIDDRAGSADMLKYDQTNRTIRMYQGLASGLAGGYAEMATTVTAGGNGTVNIWVEGVGW